MIKQYSHLQMDFFAISSFAIIEKIDCTLAHTTHWEGTEIQGKHSVIECFDLGCHFLCWIYGVVPFNTWLISSWEENNCHYKLSNWQNDTYFHSKWQLPPFLGKLMSSCAFALLVTTFIFFSAWDKSRVKLGSVGPSKR